MFKGLSKPAILCLTEFPATTEALMAARPNQVIHHQFQLSNQ